MAGLVSTGIAGFITSAKFTGKKILNAAGQMVSEIASTFVSGVSGWMIKNNGDAEFKSIYARDKIVTNEYVYNRIRVAEDEEVITSNGKILSSSDNEDGTFTVHLDLREGDINPFADGDLLQGYYHNPKNSGVIYAVQKMTVQADPDKTDQSMIVTCEDDSQPYQHMIIVRVGNLFDTDRQAFIKISSRTNCQYFHDGINSFSALDNPDNIKCAIGKADIGLIPAWATEAIGNVRKWFGLIADGVILRGTFILKTSNTTIEEEMDGMAEKFVDVETKFEIREGQISSKITETEVYAENAKKSSDNAAGSASAAAGKLETITQKESSINQTASSIDSKVSEVTTQVSNAVASAKDAAASASSAESKLVTITEKESSINQTASSITSKVTEVTKQATAAAGSASAAAGSASAAAGKLETITQKESSINQTATSINTKVSEATTYANNASASATSAADSASDAADSASNADGSATLATTKASEAKQTADGFKTTVTEETTKAVNAAVAGADKTITEKVSTAVTQSARSWKVEVLGGQDNVLAAINADASGVQIKGDKIQITGELLATIIKTYGLNVNDNFIVDSIGQVTVYGNFYTGKSGPRVYITRTQYGPQIRMFVSESGTVMDMHAFIYDNGTTDIGIKMNDILNQGSNSKTAEYRSNSCRLLEGVGDGTTYETLIEAGRIRMWKNGIERWKQDIR